MFRIQNQVLISASLFSVINRNIDSLPDAIKNYRGRVLECEQGIIARFGNEIDAEEFYSDLSRVISIGPNFEPRRGFRSKAE